MKIIIPMYTEDTVLDIKKANGFEHKPVETVENLWKRNFGTIRVSNAYGYLITCELNTKELNKLPIENLPTLTEFLNAYKGQETYHQVYNFGCKGWGYLKYFKRRIYSWKKKQERLAKKAA